VNRYLDTNFIVALITPELLSDRAAAFVAAEPGPLIVSNFAAAEFSSVIARQVRTGERTRDEASMVLERFDLWANQTISRAEVTSIDIALATIYLRRLDLTLLTPDGLHIAMAHRLGASLVTFDRRMITAARILGVPVADI
jgi:hypothetical protein